MINIGRRAADEDELYRVLASQHNIKIRVRMLDLNHTYIADFTDLFVDGQVSVDADAEVTRALDLTLFDPFKQVQLDPDSPSRTSVYITNMISIVFVVSKPDRTKLWEIPVFCGPIDSVDRDDVWIDIKCLGKESLSITNLWRGKTAKKNQRKTDVISNILKVLLGETRLFIKDKKSKMPEDMKLNRATKPWQVATKLARSMGLQLFYDGRGYAVLRKVSSKPVIVFTPWWITSKPKVAYDLHSTINAVSVVGKKPKHAKHNVSATVVAPKSHPLSPWRLGRGGVPRFLWTSISDDSLRTDKECRDLARQILSHGLLAGTEVTWDGLPCPGLEEGDVAALVMSDGSQTRFKARKFTIPLVAGDQASYGYLMRSKPRGGARAIHAKHKHKKGNH